MFSRGKRWHGSFPASLAEASIVQSELWSSEFGQCIWDEFNMITPGANCGWPTVEGIGTNPAFVNPKHQWSTAAAGQCGRIRDVVAGPAGTLWILTNNFVGSGAGTDRILQVQLIPRPPS